MKIENITDSEELSEQMKKLAGDGEKLPETDTKVVMTRSPKWPMKAFTVTYKHNTGTFESRTVVATDIEAAIAGLKRRRIVPQSIFELDEILDVDNSVIGQAAVIHSDKSKIAIDGARVGTLAGLDK
jgi:hypothetical protein